MSKCKKKWCGKAKEECVDKSDTCWDTVHLYGTCDDFKRRWKCMSSCGLCEACEDNTIPGFPGADADLSWCKLNTIHAATDAARERFCAGDYGYKCKKSCDLCN